MSKRFAWLFGVAVLVAIGALVACGSNYDPSSNGLVLLASQGSGLIETFSFNLYNGHLSEISNPPVNTSNSVCVLNGVPGSLVVNPAGTYAYTILNANSSCPNGGITGIQAFKVNSDGNAPPMGSPVAFNGSVNPWSMVMDPSGKFLFVANRANGTASGSISVFAIGSGGTITEVPGSPFVPTAKFPQATIDIVGVAPTPTVFPKIGINAVQNAVCQAVGTNPPTNEYLYAVDRLGNQVFEFQVNTSTGVLTNPTNSIPTPAFATDQIPAGVAVDPCDRFVYVSDSLSNKVSAYTICNGFPTQSSSNCPAPPLPPDGSLVQIAGSPFSLSASSNQPGPILVDPYGNNVYVLGLLSNTVSQLKISQVSGAVAAMTPATVATGTGPAEMAIRADDNWLFVTNYGSVGLGGNTMSQYSITPATGALSVLPSVPTDNYPSGVAVK